MNSLPIEQQVLGILLLYPDVIDRIRGELKPSHFHEPLHKEIYHHLIKSRDAGLIPTVVTLKQAMGEGIENHYLAGLVANAQTASTLDGLIRASIDMATKRVLKEACQRVLDAPDNANNSELMNVLSDALDDASKQSLTYAIKTDREVAEEIAEELKNPRKFYPTGLYRLDKAMAGGLHEGRLYAIAADSGHGKTMLACTISNYLKKTGVKHLYICAEMGEAETHSRSLAMDMDVDVRGFNNQAHRSEDFFSKLGNAATKEQGNVLYFSDNFLTFETLKQVLATAVAKYKVKGFILDYWQLVGGMGSRESKADFLGEVAQWQAAFCKRHKLFAINTAQLNRDGVVLGSGGLQRACDQMYFLLRPDETEPYAFMQMRKSRYTPSMHIGSAKNPSLQINTFGGYFEQISADEPQYSMVD